MDALLFLLLPFYLIPLRKHVWKYTQTANAYRAEALLWENSSLLCLPSSSCTAPTRKAQAGLLLLHRSHGHAEASSCSTLPVICALVWRVPNLLCCLGQSLTNLLQVSCWQFSTQQPTSVIYPFGLCVILSSSVRKAALHIHLSKHRSR